ncbi:alpha/beta fold hydrolase [Sinomonas notoginsengisoli]|uniref:alpha/beta fold hydrolase n=1 Tax=Sinomonas notoginsengisoli TaxID=1457311 RepID=UPI001F254940|nr:alpha/beta hydrolase [Sinomonas notoginsengisoli]
MDTIKPRVILLPGGGAPAALEFSALLTALGPDVDAVAKDLEVFAGPTPPPAYTLDDEVAAVFRFADERGWDRFHLVGYSGGGAVALATAARVPGRLESLALFEPAWAGSWGWTEPHERLWRRYEELRSLPPHEFVPTFLGLQVGPGIAVHPPFDPADPPVWMANRPAGILAFLDTFATYDLDRNALAGLAAPVYYALGSDSNPDEFEEIATKLAGVFDDFRLEVFEGRNHLAPPHALEPDRVAGSLAALWDGASRTPAGAGAAQTGEDP